MKNEFKTWEWVVIGILVVVVVIAIGKFYQEEIVGAPQIFIATPATTTPAANFGFTVGTSTPLSQFGSTTLAVYGSTTIQTPINTQHAFRVINAASSTLFQIDSTNSSSTFATDLNFYDEIRPDGALCSNNQILKKVSADTWGCATDAGGSVSLDDLTDTTLTATSTGDLLIGGPGDNWINLSIGASSTLPISNGTTLVYQATSTLGLLAITGLTGNTETGITVTYRIADDTVDYVVDNLQDLAGTLDVTSGGTGLATFTQGDLVFSDSNDSLAGLTVGASSTVLTTNGTLPAWSAEPSLASLRVTNSGTSTIMTGGLRVDIIDIQNSTASSTFANGIVLEGGCFQTAGGECLGGAGKSTIYASSTLALDGEYGAAATTTYLLANYRQPVTLISLYCKIGFPTSGATVNVEIGTGTASSSVLCNTSGIESLTTVNFGARADYFISIGTQSSDPSLITVTDEIILQ